MNDRPANTKEPTPIPDCLSEMLFDLTRAPLSAFPVAGLNEWIGIVSELISRLPKKTVQQAWINLIARGLAVGDTRQEGVIRSILIDRIALEGERYVHWRDAHAPLPEARR
jgi:hypothetical protein